jgi:hypothetical protein
VDYRYPWAAWRDWGYSLDWLARQAPASAAPLYRLDATAFPGLAVAFVTSADGALVPVRRGVIRRPVRARTWSFWELVVSPGAVWRAPESSRWAGWNKAAFPFSLVQSQESESLLGLAFFYYRGRRVSRLHVQVGRDSGGGYIFPDYDFSMRAWATVPARRAPAPPGAAAADYPGELADRWRVHPLSDLGDPVSGMGPGVDRGHVVTMGLASPGDIYRTDVRTPFGRYPYAGEMPVGTWSASKSLIAGVAALRIARKYGPSFLDSRLVSYFRPGELHFADREAAARWRMVTLRDALQMETGMGPPGAGPNWSRSSVTTYRWAYSLSLGRQIRQYFHQRPDPGVSGPGRKFRYVDQDMWAAALAMQRLLQRREGPGATLLGMLRDEVLRPIGVHHFATGTAYTRSGREGFPLTAWGALPTVDTLAKVGALIANGGRTAHGEQLLDPGLVAGLHATPGYHLSFWSLEYTARSGEKCVIPYMYGGGGNLVMCMPNGMVGFSLADNRGAEWTDGQLRSMARAADLIKPF